MLENIVLIILCLAMFFVPVLSIIVLVEMKKI